MRSDPTSSPSWLATGACSLDTRERVLLELCLEQGKTAREAADATGAEVQEVRHLLARVARQLRATLGPPC